MSAGPSFTDAIRVSPFEVAVAGDSPRTAPRSKAQLLALSRRAERRQLAGNAGDLVLVALQEGRFWTAQTSAVYSRIAQRGATVAVFAQGLPTDLAPHGSGRVSTVCIEPDDLLADEWLVIFCSPQERWGFLARDAASGLPGARSGPRVPRQIEPGQPEQPESERMFEWADLNDPIWLERAAAVLLTRVPSLAVMVPWLIR